MIDVAKSLPVNSNLEPGEPILSAPDIWRGLVMKAEDPVPFVKPITACTILERTANGLVREIVHKGETMRKRITYDVGRSVTFVRETGTERGTIINEIVDDPTDGLLLRFAFKLEIEGMKPGSPEETAFAKSMENDYVPAVKATIMQIRRLVREGKLKNLTFDAFSAANREPTSPENAMPHVAVPDWVEAHYRDVDALDAERVAAWFTDDGMVIFANHPPVVGRSAIKTALGGFMSSIRGMKHEFRNVWDVGAVTVFEASVTYTRKDGTAVVIPAATFLERRGDKIRSCRIYVDHAPLRP
jgi:ketosteroid isomerase-like protein